MKINIFNKLIQTTSESNVWVFIHNSNNPKYLYFVDKYGGYGYLTSYSFFKFFSEKVIKYSI